MLPTNVTIATMNILHLRSSGGFYGAENVIIQLASRQSSDAVKAYVGCIQAPNAHNELFERCQSLGIDAQLLPCTGTLDRAALSSIRSSLKNNQIDVICCHDYKSAILGYAASIGLNLKRLAINHLWDFIDTKLWLYQRIEGILYNAFDHVVAVSAPVAKDVRPFLVNKSKLSVISNGVDTHAHYNYEGSRTLRACLGLSENDLVLGVVGRLASQKGHRYLIEAASKLVSKHKYLKLVFWGQGHLEGSLRELVAEHKLQDHVVFAGVAKDMAQVYNEIDILTMPSLSEGLPMAMLEAMSAEVLVLATPVGDIPEVITDGDTGFLTPAKNSQQLANDIEKLIAMPVEQRTRVAQSGREFIVDNLSADAMAENYAALLETL